MALKRKIMGICFLRESLGFKGFSTKGGFTQAGRHQNFGPGHEKFDAQASNMTPNGERQKSVKILAPPHLCENPNGN